jgi:zinc finger SWIM domain-containing protein 3
MQVLCEKKADAANYLQAIDPALWCEAFFPSQRNGHNTSNIVETQINSLKLDRELPVLMLLDSLYHRIMEKRGLRHQAAIKHLEGGRTITPYAEGVLRESRQWTQGNYGQVSSATAARIIQPDGRIYLVNLEEKTCTCRRFQSSGIPCDHALTVIQRLGHSATTYLPENASTPT